MLGFSFQFQLLQDKKTQKTEVEDSTANMVSTHQTTCHCILEDTSLNIHCHKNIKSHNERQFAEMMHYFAIGSTWSEAGSMLLLLLPSSFNWEQQPNLVPSDISVHSSYRLHQMQWALTRSQTANISKLFLQTVVHFLCVTE